MKLIKAFCILLIISPVQAQEVDDFLDCAEYSDRVERAFCLEKALDQAVEQQNVDSNVDESSNQETAVTVENFGTAVESKDMVSEGQEADNNARKGSRFRLPVIGNLFRRNNSDEAEESDSERDGVEEVTAETGSVDNFGRRQTRANVTINNEGQNELSDVITALEEVRPSQWEITLASGQIWQQTHVKRFNLRENEKVRIYPSKWGKNFRLETERLSGFIQVVRVE